MTTSLVIMSFLLTFSTGCKKNESPAATGKDVYTIAVISDLHYMDPSLRPDPNSTTLKTFVSYDQRLSVESDAIMREVISELINANPKPDLVLVPGDLSLDGELVSHNSVARFLSQLVSAGIKVRVIDGNHDINFNMAVMFTTNDTVPVPNINPATFRNIYRDFGFNDAVSTDPNSLSYVSEPLPGLRILAIDACKYDPQYDSDMVGGHIRQETMTWALLQLAEAKAKGKMVFGMMHHALINHFTDQNVSFPDFVVDSASGISDAFMNAGLKLVFTGHGHASDIVKKTNGNKFLYDIETASTVAYPCSYRMLTYIKDSALIISTVPIQQIDFPIPSGLSFQEYARQRIYSVEDTDYTAIYSQKYAIDTARRLAPRMRAALMAQMAGDENILSTSEFDSINSTSAWLGAAFSWKYKNYIWKPYILDFWNDLPPADNSLMINLKSGTSYKK